MYDWDIHASTMSTPTENHPQAVRLDDEARREIERLAKKLGVSKSALIRMALAKGLPKVRAAFA